MGAVERRWRSFVLAAVLFAVPAAGAAAGAAAAQQPPMRVLFIGNSYLYTNKLPGVVEQLASRQGHPIEATLLAEPDYSLADHLRSGRLDAVLDQHWDWVVLQQGPSALPASRGELLESTRGIAARLQGKPTRMALMSAWPAQRNASMSSQAEASYSAAAVATGACVLPVATAWRLARQRPGLPALYQADQLHPTRAGSLLAALVVTRGLLGMESSLQPATPSGGTPLLAHESLVEVAGEAHSQEEAHCASTASSAAFGHEPILRAGTDGA